MVHSREGLTGLLITLSAIPARASPEQSAPRPRSTPVDGPFPTRARSDPAAPPGLPGPEGRPRQRRLAARAAPPDRARPGGTLRLQPDHDSPGARRAGSRGTAGADPGPRHVRVAPPDRSRLCRTPLVHRRDADPRPGPRD